MSKRFIPNDREEDVLHMYWMLLQAFEGQCNMKSALDVGLIEAAYNQLNQINYTKARPKFEKNLDQTAQITQNG